MYTEPEAQVTYRGQKAETGHGYDWLGNKTGAGGMTLTRVSDTRIECDLQFLKPFKSQADVAFDLHESGPAQTRVTWHMNSRLPIFMFWMQASMAGMIRSDYNRGLRLLKDYIELGVTGSSTQAFDIVSVEAQPYIGVQASTDMADISASMDKTFNSLVTGARDSDVTITGKPFSLYNKIDIKQGRCTYTAALPIAQLSTVALPLVSSTRPACSALKVVHTGPYRHLGNAWAVLMGEARHRKLKAHKGIPPFESYLNDPDTTLEADLITELYFPVRG